MTKTIVAYQIDVKLFTSSKIYKAPSNASANEVCRAMNGAIYRDVNSDLLLAFNPINISQANCDTPVYVVYEDGSKELTDTADFFSFLSRYELTRVFVRLDMDELDLHEDTDEVSERTQWIQLRIDVEKFVEHFVITTKETVNPNGRERECLQFIVEENIKYISHSERYGLNHPSFKGLPGVVKPKPRISAKASKDAVARVVAVAEQQEEKKPAEVEENKPAVVDVSNMW